MVVMSVSLKQIQPQAAEGPQTSCPFWEFNQIELNGKLLKDLFQCLGILF